MGLRKLSELGDQVGADVVAAVAAIEASGGLHTHDSGHIVGPTWIYTFPAHSDAQVALRINRRKLSVYLRANPHGRGDFESLVASFGHVERVYPNSDEKPANSLLSVEHAPFLTPKCGRLLRVTVESAKFEPLLRAYLRSPPAGRAKDYIDESLKCSVSNAAENNDAKSSSASRTVPPLSPDALRRQLDRNDAIGQAGERVAYADEIARLRTLGCPDSEACVRVVADDDVATGYDIRSSWNGEIRCIEVKSSTRDDSDFFITANERAVLTKLGQHAWLYRVRVNDDGGGEVVQRLQDPMSKVPATAMQPVVWRVDSGQVDA